MKSKLLDLLEKHNALQLPCCICMKRITLCNCLCSTFFPSFRFSASLVRDFGIVNRYSWFWKFPNMADQDGDFNFFKVFMEYHHLHKIYDHQIWLAGTSRGVDSTETNQAGSGDAITPRSRDKLKTYLG